MAQAAVTITQNTDGDVQLPDFDRYRRKYGPELQKHFDLVVEAWTTHPEIRSRFPAFSTFNNAVRKPSMKARRDEAHALVRRHTNYEIANDKYGLPVFRRPGGDQPDVIIDLRDGAELHLMSAVPVLDAELVEASMTTTDVAVTDAVVEHVVEVEAVEVGDNGQILIEEHGLAFATADMEAAIPTAVETVIELPESELISPRDAATVLVSPDDAATLLVSPDDAATLLADPDDAATVVVPRTAEARTAHEAMPGTETTETTETTEDDDAKSVPLVVQLQRHSDLQDVDEAGNPVPNGVARSRAASDYFVSCPNCAKAFTPTQSAVRKALVASRSGLGGALVGATLGASAGAGIGIAAGGPALVGTIPLGLIGGLVGGSVLVVGSKLGAEWAMTRFPCPGCQETLWISPWRR